MPDVSMGPLMPRTGGGAVALLLTANGPHAKDGRKAPLYASFEPCALFLIFCLGGNFGGSGDGVSMLLAQLVGELRFGAKLQKFIDKHFALFLPSSNTVQRWRGSFPSPYDWPQKGKGCELFRVAHSVSRQGQLTSRRRPGSLPAVCEMARLGSQGAP